MQTVLVGRVPKDRRCLQEYFVTDKVGRYVCTINAGHFAQGRQQGLDYVRYLVENGLYFTVYCVENRPGGGWSGEVQSSFPKDLADEIKSIAGDHLLGVWVTTEFGSLIYWPRDYLSFEDGFLSRNRASYGSYDGKTLLGKRLLGARDLADAKERFVGIVRDIGCFHREFWGDTPLCSIESSTLEKYCFEAGCGFSSHEIMPSAPLLELSTARSVTRAYGKERFGAHIAIGCYGGWREDRLKNMRWRLALYLSYIAGAGLIYEEGGHYKEPRHDYEALRASGINMQWDLPEYAFYRDELIRFNEFVKRDQRPAGFPLTPVGLLHGHLDGWCGMWDNRVWGQVHSPEWQYGEAEHGWNYFHDFFRKLDWGENAYYGERNLTGNPPCGQMDLVPIESGVENWSNYNCLLMLGWNTMTEENYAKLRAWVKAGGRLIAAVPHLRTDIRRTEEITLIHDGDFSDLFGVRVAGPTEEFTCGARFLRDPSIPGYLLPTFNNFQRFTDPACVRGPIPLADVSLAGATVLACQSKGADAIEEHPLLVENKLGTGVAMLLTTWCYPGREEMGGVMRCLLNAIISGEQAGPIVVAPDTVRYAIYREGAGFRGYFLNADFDLPARIRVTDAEGTHEREIPATGMEVLRLR